MSRLRHFATLFWTLLRELADENAYRRYLSVTGQTHSAAQWKHFSDQRLRGKYARAKCC